MKAQPGRDLMNTPRRRPWGVSRLVVIALLSPLAMMGTWPVHAGSDRPPLDALLRDAGISPPLKPLPAPSFSVADLAGGTVDLDRLRGKVVLLYFWTTW